MTRTRIWYYLLLNIVSVAAIWIISEVGYLALVSVLGVGSGYSLNPYIMTLYYVVWIIVTLLVYRTHLYKIWKLELDASTCLTIIALIGPVVLYLWFILPAFPPIHWNPALTPPSDLLISSTWYFMPKSVEILLQQFLMVALVRSFFVSGFSLRATSLWCAALFGSTHLLMVFDAGTAAYVGVFTLLATVAGFIFPYLLQIKNGFVYSYFLHWGFYAVFIILIRVLFIS
jgi:hypothetical protein